MGLFDSEKFFSEISKSDTSDQDFLIRAMKINHRLILRSLPDDYADIYNTKVKSMKVEIGKMPYLDAPDKAVLARCKPSTNTIYVSKALLNFSKKWIQRVLMHEQYHLGSSDNERNKCGLYQIDKIGAAINEGMTEYLTFRTLDLNSFRHCILKLIYIRFSGYDDLIKLMLSLSKTGLIDYFEHNYFIGDIYYLSREFSILLDLEYETVLDYFASLDVTSFCNSSWKIKSDVENIPELQRTFMDRCNVYGKRKNKQIL